MKVAILGAGVLGTATAAGLAARGAQVTLVDWAGPGAGTSSRGAGLVCEGMWHPTSLRLVRRTMEILARMGEEGERAGHPLRFHVTGSTTLVPAALADHARDLAAHQKRHGADVRVLAPEDAARLPRHDRMRLDDVALSLHYPRDGWALPRLYCEVLAHGLAAAGRVRLVKARARLARGADGRVEARVDGEALDADTVVVAAGVHARALLRGVGLDAPVQAYRTQALRFVGPGAHALPILHDAVQGFYLRPHWTGQLVAGNGTTTTPEDPDGWKREPDDAFVARTLARLRHRFPALQEGACEQAWAGIDAATPDRLLLAGAYPGEPGLWLAVGGNGHGFMRGPAAGESLAALLLGDKPAVALDGYEPARFVGAMSRPFDIREGYTIESPSF